MRRRPGKELSNQLLQIGVPRELHYERFGSLSGGDSVRTWLQTKGCASIANGGNWYFITYTPDHHKLLPTMVGQYFASGGLASFARLGTLVHLLETRDHKKFDTISSQYLLAIGDFFAPAVGPRERPFTTLKRSLIEEMLLRRKDQRLPTILQIHNPSHLSLNHIPWWTNTVLERMEMKTFRVDES